MKNLKLLPRTNWSDLWEASVEIARAIPKVNKKTERQIEAVTKTIDGDYLIVRNLV